RRTRRSRRAPGPWGIQRSSPFAGHPSQRGESWKDAAVQDQSLIQLPPALAEPARQANGRYLLGIDGGATKTLAAVLDLERPELHIAHGGPSNEDAVGARAAVGALLSVADAAAQRAGVAPAQIVRSVLAVAGTDTDSIQRHVHDVR